MPGTAPGAASVAGPLAKTPDPIRSRPPSAAGRTERAGVGRRRAPPESSAPSRPGSALPGRSGRPGPARTRSSPATSVAPVGTAVRIRLALLVVGLVGFVAIAWSMLYTAQGAAVAGRLGMARVQGNLDEILGILAVPVMLFFAILAAWSLVDLFRLYRAANDPASYGRGRGSPPPRPPPRERR